MGRASRKPSESNSVLILLGCAIGGVIMLAVCGGIFIAPMISNAISQGKEEVNDALSGEPLPPDFQGPRPGRIPVPQPVPFTPPSFEVPGRGELSIPQPTPFPSPSFPSPPFAETPGQPVTPFPAPPAPNPSPFPPNFTPGPSDSRRQPARSYPITQPIPGGWQQLGAATQVTKGTKLQAEWGRKWYTVTVLEDCNSGAVLITWDNWKGWDEPINRNSLIIKN